MAEDVGRLRRHLQRQGWPGGDYIEFLFERLSLDVCVVDAMDGPTAAELYRLFLPEAGGDETLAVKAALELVDKREATLRRALNDFAPRLRPESGAKSPKVTPTTSPHPRPYKGRGAKSEPPRPSTSPLRRPRAL